MEQEISDLKSQYEVISNDLDDANKILNLCQENIKHLIEKIIVNENNLKMTETHLDTKIDDNSNKISECKITINNHNVKFDKLKNDIYELGNSFEINLHSMISDLETKLKKQMDSNTSKITEFQLIIDDHSSMIDRVISDRISQLEFEMDRIKNIENFYFNNSNKVLNTKEKVENLPFESDGVRLTGKGLKVKLFSGYIPIDPKVVYKLSFTGQ